jgi:hypothetical protein
MADDIILCYDLTHPEEHRAPFCTKVANKNNLVEGDEQNEDLYFCDACFGAGHEILAMILQGIESGKTTYEEVNEAMKEAAADRPEIKKGKN